MIPEREREALMRLTMCAREECGMCKYKETCNFDFQFNLATENMNILADALTADCKEEPQYDTDKGTIKCDNCSENGSYKCTKCDGEIYFKRLEGESQTEEERCREVVRGFMSIVNEMRNPTEEEQESVNKYIESISKPTGVNIFDMMDESQTDCPWR